MKIGRRGFLGFMGGAVASGPKLARGIVTENFDASGSVAEMDTKWSAKSSGKLARAEGRVEELLTRLSPDEDEKARARAMRAASLVAARYRLDALVSVSPQHKMMMLGKIEHEHERAYRKSRWQDEIQWLLSEG